MKTSRKLVFIPIRQLIGNAIFRTKSQIHHLNLILDVSHAEKGSFYEIKFFTHCVHQLFAGAFFLQRISLRARTRNRLQIKPNISIDWSHSNRVHS